MSYPPTRRISTNQIALPHTPEFGFYPTRRESDSSPLPRNRFARARNVPTGSLSPCSHFRQRPLVNAQPRFTPPRSRSLQSAQRELRLDSDLHLRVVRDGRGAAASPDQIQQGAGEQLRHHSAVAPPATTPRSAASGPSGQPGPKAV